MAINWFMEPVPQSGGSGSGSIIDEEGHVMTNYHVIKDAYKLFVNLADGSRYEAKVVGTDQQNDLAVIQFKPPAGKNSSRFLLAVLRTCGWDKKFLPLVILLDWNVRLLKVLFLVLDVLFRRTVQRSFAI